MHAIALSKFSTHRLAGFIGLLAATISSLFAASTPADRAKASASLTTDSSRLIVDVHGVPPPAPVFFSATVDQVVRIDRTELLGEWRVKLRVVQGRPEVLTLGLSGDGDVIDVAGANLRDWSVRQGSAAASGQRFLDLRPVLPEVRPMTAVADARQFEFTVRTRTRGPESAATGVVLIATPGDAVGFAANVALQPDASVDVRVTNAAGMTTLRNGTAPHEIQPFFYTGEGRMEIRVSARGASLAEAELIGAQLIGRVTELADSVEFRLRGQLRAQKAGARLRLLSGRAALSEKTTGEGWHVELVAGPGRDFAYDLVSDREGVIPVELVFAAAVREQGDWRVIDFAMPAGAVVPLRLEELGAAVSFKPDARVVPVVMTSTLPAGSPAWQGFLPADGGASLAWKRTREKGESALAFTSFEQSEIRISAGLLRQTAQLSFRVLQGKLGTVRCRLDGPGEIIGVEGANVTGWKVLPADGGRVLEIRLSRPLETQGALTIQSQAELGTWPARAEPLRLTPQGGVRHSGFVRIANSGAVRLEVTEVAGMMQLAPGQFPGAAIEKDARQVFVYRFPSATYSYRVLATQIQPEVSVSAIATYELGETARVINASLELDVREASLRDWTLRIPEDYTVVAVTGNDVADYVAETDAANGTRALRILFGRAIDGRQLVQLRLEKNQATAAGDWTLPALQFPGAKSVRGHVGAVSTPGYRLVPASADRLVEVPLSFFPKQTPGLQQAWRLREPDWTAAVRIEALGQSVQADVFHLYSLKEGVVTSSVLLNYFVVGAPATEWRVEVPAGVGNIDVIGQNVRRDWRREGDQVIVTLHQPVLGAATLLITFEQPMSARGGVIAPGQVRPLGVQAERGFIQVVSPLQVKHEVRRAEGLLKLEPTELPTEFRLLTSSPSLAVYQYTARPFALEMNIEWYPPGEPVDQVIDFAQLSSQVSRDGQVVTQAKFFVKTRGRKALRLLLPEATKLWEAKVDNEVVNARADGQHTVIPLPARLNPSDPVVVVLRLGQSGGKSGTAITLLAPRAVSSPTVISEWIVRSDAGRLLVPQRGNAELLRPALTETGFEWISGRGGVGTLITIGLLGLGVLLLNVPAGWRLPTGLFALALATAGALLLTGRALAERRPNAQELIFATTIVPPGETLSLQLDNLPEWRAMIVGWGLALSAAGIVLLVIGSMRGRSRERAEGRPLAHARSYGLVVVVGVVMVAAGILAHRGGAIIFFGTLSGAIFLRMLVPGVILWRRERRERMLEPGDGAAGAGATGVVSMLVLTALALAFGGVEGIAAQPKGAPKVAPAPSRPQDSDGGWKPALLDGAKPAQSMVQSWTIRQDRLFANLEVTVRGAPGDRFLLLRPPAVLTEFRGDGVRVTKVEQEGQARYFIVPEREGTLTAHARFEMPVADRAQPIDLPTGPAAMQRLTVELDQAGWEFTSPMAVQVVPATGGAENRSAATLVLSPHASTHIQLHPRRRDIGAEATQFFSEGANLFVPGPGVVNGTARVTIRPVQGRVSTLELVVPAGLTVGDVVRGPVGAWRFDPQSRRLHVAIEPAQAGVFHFDVETQLGAGELPFALALEPLRVLGATADVGLLAIAFGGDAQPEAVRAVDLSVVSVQDFDAALLPRTREGAPTAALQRVWRYGASGGRVELKVAPVAAEVRVASRQVLSLDDDRMVMAVDVRVAITRVGLFKLSFVLPEGLEIESLTGAALNHWTEAAEATQRIITLHLNGRTIGEHAFNLTLAGAAPRAQDAWAFPRVVVREATRHTGEVLVVPGKGIRLRAVDREKVTQLDPRTVGGQQPGTLAFRLLQEDWVLRLGIEMLEAWTTAQVLQEVTLREGQTLTRIALRYRVENAAVKTVRVRLPGLSAESERTVRATGSAVSDIVKLPATDGPDRWEIRFQRGIAGETDVQIEYQSTPARERAQEPIATPELIGARQTTQFVAVRSGGQLELEVGALPRGWLRVDWSAVPLMLQARSDRSVPAFCFRVAEPEGALAVTVRRHQVAEALKLRITQADLLTLCGPTGDFLSAVELKVDVLEKSTLRVRLPSGARMFNTLVNGVSVPVVREGDAWLFHVTPNTGGDRGAAVRLVYAVTADAARGHVTLIGPSLSVPLENVSWRVVIPPGYELDDYRGGLRLREERFGSSFGVDQYVSLVSSKRSADTQAAMSILQQASSWMQKGEQDKAAEALSRVSNGTVLDQATNEDARVQLRNLKTQQAVLGLNTRRQRMYFDNRFDTAQNAQLEQAANLNPLMQGKLNFDPRQADQLLQGNSAEENTALRGIAARIVDQQLAAEPAPGAIDVTLPERGRVLTFTRSLQVDGAAPLELRLDLDKITRTNWPLMTLFLAALAVIAVMDLNRRTNARA